MKLNTQISGVDYSDGRISPLPWLGAPWPGDEENATIVEKVCGYGESNAVVRVEDPYYGDRYYLAVA